MSSAKAIADSMARIQALQAALSKPAVTDEDESEEAEMARQWAEQEAQWAEWQQEGQQQDNQTQDNTNENNNTATIDTDTNVTTITQPNATSTADITTGKPSVTTQLETTDSNKENQSTISNTQTNNANNENNPTINNTQSSTTSTFNALLPIQDWSTQQCILWLDKIHNKLLSYTDIFRHKGWTNNDIDAWNNDVNTLFNQYNTYWQTNNIDGKILNDIYDDTLHNKCNVTNQYHRSLMLSNLIQYKRKTTLKT